MKPGTRLKSLACETEVMVIRCSDGAIECGGAAMIGTGQGEVVPLVPEYSNGTLMGKRYVDADNQYELLCVKPGKGSLSVDGIALVTKDAKPLPASD